MRAIILSAGKPPDSDEPIFAVEVEHSTLGEIQAGCLRACGIEEITVVLGYHADSWNVEGVRTLQNERWRNSGAVASLQIASDVFDGRDDVLIAYGDTIFEPDVIRKLARSIDSIRAVCYLDRSEDDRMRYREFAHITGGLIESITASASAANGVRTVFTGLVLVGRQRADAVRAHLKEWSNAQAHVGELLEHLVRRGVDIAPVMIETGWAEVANRAGLNALAKITIADGRFAFHTDWAKRAEAYNRLQWVNEDALLQAIMRVAERFAPRRMLDVGTGTGKVLLGLREFLGGGEYWGVDSSKAMLAKLKAPPDVKIVCDDAESLSAIPSEYFDLITARMVFHHLQHPYKAARAAVRSLSPGGCFLICEGVPPTRRSVEWYTEMFRYKEDRRTITEGDLAHFLISAEMENVETHSVVMRRASLNNWLDNAGLPEENLKILRDMHFNAPSYIKEDYDMEFRDGDCFMTWRFAVTFGRKPRHASKDAN